MNGFRFERFQVWRGTKPEAALMTECRTSGISHDHSSNDNLDHSQAGAILGLAENAQNPLETPRPFQRGFPKSTGTPVPQFRHFLGFRWIQW